MKQLKLPDVGDHILLKTKTKPQFLHEAILTFLDEEEYCAVDLEKGEGLSWENELICCDSIPELLGEIQKHCDIYFIED